MLIRICDHFRDNPKRIDKLIAIKGLPKEWLFVETSRGLELRKPWREDVEANVPHEIRHLCEPFYVNFRYSPIEKGAQEVIDHRRVIGLKIDYNTEPGREMWDQVERYVEESIPRHERIPVPVLCAKDERSSFQTYTPRRSSTGSLELVPAEVPCIDLARYVQVIVQDQPSVVSPETPPPPVKAAPAESAPQAPQAATFKCDDCNYTHSSNSGIRMHRIKKHPREKVGSK